MAEDRQEYEQTVRTSVSSGQLLTAIEVARDGLRRFPDSTPLRQQLALALVQTGALEAAQDALSELPKQDSRNEETLSLLGRIHKELWRRAPDAGAAAAALKEAARLYGQAFELKGSYYPGINLAFALAAGGDLEEARSCAAKVAKRCREELKKSDAENDGWLLGTMGEALVHLGKTEEAATWYRKAAEAFKGRWRDLASMQRQAREITEFFKDAGAQPEAKWNDLASIQRRARDFLFRPQRPTKDWLDRCFEFPTVVVFAGHMIDRSDRPEPRFPSAREAEVRKAINAYLDEVKAGVGYSSAACGGDLIFCECLLERGAKVNLVLPGPVDAFKRQSVAFAGPEWEKRFHNVLANATSCLFANASEAAPSDVDPATAEALTYSNRIVLGLAALQARSLDLELRALAVWDGRPGDAPGGTASNVVEWRARGFEPKVINPMGKVSDVVPAAAAPRAGSASAKEGVIRQRIMAVVLAEVLNYRKITEVQMPAYIRKFKTPVRGILDSLPEQPEVIETWAGTNHFIFASLEAASLCATALRDFARSAKWEGEGLPEDLGLRVAVHAGPVFSFLDPQVARANCIGAHATRTTRMIPVTPGGQVYASQEFAALCGAEGIDAVSFEFLGRIPTTKLFEDAPLYRLDRQTTPAG